MFSFNTLYRFSRIGQRILKRFNRAKTSDWSNKLYLLELDTEALCYAFKMTEIARMVNDGLSDADAKKVVGKCIYNAGFTFGRLRHGHIEKRWSGKYLNRITHTARQIEPELWDLACEEGYIKEGMEQRELLQSLNLPESHIERLCRGASV